MSINAFLYLLATIDSVKAVILSVSVLGYIASVVFGTVLVVFCIRDAVEEEWREGSAKRISLVKIISLVFCVSTFTSLVNALLPSAASVASIYEGGRVYKTLTDPQVEKIAPDMVEQLRKAYATEQKKPVAK